MKTRCACIVLWAGLTLAASAADAPRSSNRSGSPVPLASAALGTARAALFEDSDLDAGRQAAKEALTTPSDQLEALFIEMEAAALEADTAAELDAALRLCELKAAPRDPRVQIAAARIADLAANTEEFRAALPRIRALLGNGSRNQLHRLHPQANYLRAAMLSAAMDGAPGLVARQIARESGLMLDWRVAGPFGKFANLDFDRAWPPERDTLARSISGARAVERLQFDDGNFRLPEYFSGAGVFYATSDTVTAAAGQWLVRAESAGTLEIFIDGISVLRKDDRIRSGPQITSQAVTLQPGAHRVLVKFLPSASSFRIALVPSQAPISFATARPIDYAPEAAYVAAAQKYWRGDFAGAIAELDGRQTSRSAVADFLLYQAWTHASASSPEAPALLHAVLAAAPAALAAEYELASRACSAARDDECAQHLARVLGSRPRHADANALFAQLAIRMHWNAQAIGALELQMRIHPSCESLRQAYKFFSRQARYARAKDIEKQIASCAPDTLAELELLDESGRHAEAAAAADSLLRRYPLDRSARELQVRQLALVGEVQKARLAAKELAAIAPNSAQYRGLARIADSDPESLLDTDSLAVRDYVGSAAFFTRYRRDGRSLVQQAKDRKFSGGPAVILLNDRVVRLWDDGGVSVYVHKVTRVIDRDGIERYGEVELPRGAEILELRTIKADGSVAEPELNARKATLSMPALSAGDAIDVEYVTHFADGLGEHAAELQHTFGSFRAPILFSRFCVISPAGHHSQVAVIGDVAAARSDADGGLNVRVWEKNDIPQSVEEVAIARGDILPTARIELETSAAEAVDRDRDALISALQIGPHVEQVAAQVGNGNPEEKARAIYRLVARRIRSSQKTVFAGKLSSAEQILASGAGSRCVVILAMARAVGLPADLVLSRPAGTMAASNHSAQLPIASYTRPLVLFHLPHRDVIVDPEADGLAFGALPPAVERREALLVPVSRDSQALATGPVLMPLEASLGNETSTADADVFIDEQGGLEARATIVLGAWRAAQMRGILSAVEPAQRPNFYQQLALRIFQRGDTVTGSVRNELDTDRPLQIELRCRAQRLVDLSQQTNDLDQLVPALGLKKMYVAAGQRNFPLFVDTPLVERATFRIHLPRQVTVLLPPSDTDLKTEFGMYALAFRRLSPTTIEVERSFRIPVQVVSVQRFPEFARFAGRIDDAERQRITVAKTAATTH